MNIKGARIEEEKNEVKLGGTGKIEDTRRKNGQIQQRNEGRSPEWDAENGVARGAREDESQ